MITKGSKIKLIKEMGLFRNIGEICEVTDVAEGGVITFRFGCHGHHLGCMSYDEYLKYFEPVETTSKRAWTPWETINLSYYDINGKIFSRWGFARHNNKKVQVKFPAYKLRTEASCHHDDVFDYQAGLKLATKRLVVKILNYEIEKEAKEM